ncbi:glycosyltransferase [Luteolibacter marinus]|uniref:glycosyltransferase n=1 Tax=Luteolibacter marinus TaxID=2776705 RepID=UPI0018687BE1|nr:glycosyltransferase [Luteolibacter marinus]
MKLVVFAHVPPPHHGQSAMVKLMLDGLGSGAHGDFELLHVDARFSDTMAEVGGSGLGKVVRAIRFAARAIHFRLTEGARVFYYVPAPPKFAAMARDWIVLALCRPFFPKVIFHWHAVGLGAWTEEARTSGELKDRLAACLNRLLLGRHHRSLVLTGWARSDVAVFAPREIAVVGNGIADPCPDFDRERLETRRARVESLRRSLLTDGLPDHYRVCFLGHCMEEKGLWDAMRAVAIAAAQLRPRPLGIRLAIAGEFPTPRDRETFAALKDSLAAEFGLADDWVEHAGFVGGEAKRRFLERADCLVFPTRYAAESFGLVAAEALAFGIPPVTSDWRMLPELMGAVGLPVATAGDPGSIAHELVASIGRDDPARLRAEFLARFTAEAHLEQLAQAIGR